VYEELLLRAIDAQDYRRADQLQQRIKALKVQGVVFKPRERTESRAAAMQDDDDDDDAGTLPDSFLMQLEALKAYEAKQQQSVSIVSTHFDCFVLCIVFSVSLVCLL
jgi:hypothetical protein